MYLFLLGHCFRNRHQYKITFSCWYSVIFYGGGWKGDQILKCSVSYIAIKQKNSSNIFLIAYEEAMLLEFSPFISVKDVICFSQIYNRVTVTLSYAITEKNLYLNLLVTCQIFLCAVRFTRSLIFFIFKWMDNLQ